MQPIELAVLGAGNRGTFAYGGYAQRNPHMAKMVAIAEPDAARRERFAAQHGIPAERQFADWRELVAQPQLAQGLINTTMDRMHLESTLAALDAGYDVLCEKPMATSAEDCMRLVLAAESASRLLQICHVLRYTTFWRTLYDIVSSGRLGRVITVEHRENVAYWHMAHSFVRGNWGNSDTSAPMILAKCCHDMDILYWILGQRARKMSAYGRLTHFTAENAPAGAPARCTDGCPAQDACPYYAPRQYLVPEGGWPATTISIDQSLEGRMHALREGPYGRCVYRCDNNVVDHHLIAMELEDDTTLSFVMQGHSHNNVRTMRYDGTRATLRATAETREIVIHDHLTGAVETIQPGEVVGGHGGGDTGVMQAYIAALRGSGDPLTSARTSLESHLMAFASEEARVSGEVVDMAAYRKKVEEKVKG